jgi:hypothetical protein
MARNAVADDAHALFLAPARFSIPQLVELNDREGS